MTRIQINEIVDNIILNIRINYPIFNNSDMHSVKKEIERLINEEITSNHNDINPSDYTYTLYNDKGKTILLNGIVNKNNAVHINLQIEIGKAMRNLYHETLIKVETYLSEKELILRKYDAQDNKHTLINKNDEIIITTKGKQLDHFLGLPVNSINELKKKIIRNINILRKFKPSKSNRQSILEKQLETYIEKLKYYKGTTSFKMIANEIASLISTSQIKNKDIRRIIPLIKKINLIIINENMTQDNIEELITSEEILNILGLYINKNGYFKNIETIFSFLEKNILSFKNGIPDEIKTILLRIGVDSLNILAQNALNNTKSNIEDNKKIYLKNNFKNNLISAIQIYNPELFDKIKQSSDDQFTSIIYSFINTHKSCFPAMFEITRIDVAQNIKKQNLKRPIINIEKSLNTLPLCITAEYLSKQLIELERRRITNGLITNFEDRYLLDTLLDEDNFFLYLSNVNRIPNFAKIVNKCHAAINVCNSIARGEDIYKYRINKNNRYIHKIGENGQRIQTLETDDGYLFDSLRGTTELYYNELMKRISNIDKSTIIEFKDNSHSRHR